MNRAISQSVITPPTQGWWRCIVVFQQPAEARGHKGAQTPKCIHLLSAASCLCLIGERPFQSAREARALFLLAATGDDDLGSFVTAGYHDTNISSLQKGLAESRDLFSDF